MRLQLLHISFSPRFVNPFQNTLCWLKRKCGPSSGPSFVPPGQPSPTRTTHWVCSAIIPAFTFFFLILPWEFKDSSQPAALNLHVDHGISQASTRGRIINRSEKINLMTWKKAEKTSISANDRNLHEESPADLLTLPDEHIELCCLVFTHRSKPCPRGKWSTAGSSCLLREDPIWWLPWGKAYSATQARLCTSELQCPETQ